MNQNLIYLAQTDTTAGLLSADFKKLNVIKERSPHQRVLIEVDSLSVLKNSVRVPQRFKNRVRRSHKSTFIFPDKQAFRVIKDEVHLGFLKKFTQMYSTSANKTGRPFDYQKAFEMCEVVVLDSRGIFCGNPSKIFKINQSKIIRIR
ncbi:Sua5 YciO YrdC YwlC family protein [Helicobacter sp. 12S02232-10]|uniref:Sua5 YciO YrdC YwlC family protein n=1 Tax=Helicobacter sp. 12S02232-10 TaxID=1476197 RepID=UPI000BA7C608|nr:Sua5 YciO YrdC YwlC family protein [Helicobacter sp. 12S02232-10]PAF46893.1 Sua5 YciO YrdC YwlC family protein [Helicobacter sp. 12S02232-10]